MKASLLDWLIVVGIGLWMMWMYWKAPADLDDSGGLPGPRHGRKL